MENPIKMDDLGVPLFWKHPYTQHTKCQGEKGKFEEQYESSTLRSQTSIHRTFSQPKGWGELCIKTQWAKQLKEKQQHGNLWAAPVFLFFG